MYISTVYYASLSIGSPTAVHRVGYEGGTGQCGENTDQEAIPGWLSAQGDRDRVSPCLSADPTQEESGQWSELMGGRRGRREE